MGNKIGGPGNLELEVCWLIARFGEWVCGCSTGCVKIGGRLVGLEEKFEWEGG